MPPPPPFSPSLISLMVSVDVKHHDHLGSKLKMYVWNPDVDYPTYK